MKILDEIKKVPRETPLHDEKGRPKRSLKSLLVISKKKEDSEKDFRHKYFVGRITRIDNENQIVQVDYEGHIVTYEFSQLDELVHAYAVSVHKSQGSEYPAVVIPMMMQHYMMLRRNLLYTGITRGKKLVILVGQKKAIGMAVKGKVEARRWSKLGEWLQG